MIASLLVMQAENTSKAPTLRMAMANFPAAGTYAHQIENAIRKITAYSCNGNGKKISKTETLSWVTTLLWENVNEMMRTTEPDVKTKNQSFEFRGSKFTEADQPEGLTNWFPI